MNSTSTDAGQLVECQICHQKKLLSEMLPAELVRDSVVETILLDHPDWKPGGFICTDDLKNYRVRNLMAGLEKDPDKLPPAAQDVLKSMSEQKFLSRNVDVEVEQKYTFGQRLADRIAEFGGSWRFLIIFGVILLVWIAVNTVALLRQPFDPFPFILLNLVLSCLAAIQAPVIMMSQNRQEAKDRVRADHDYRVNLKAEIEIQQLHEKMDHYLVHQWQRLLDIQNTQLEIMNRLLNAKDEGGRMKQKRFHD
jgi:uncharacterized membrane protein